MEMLLEKVPQIVAMTKTPAEAEALFDAMADRVFAGVRETFVTTIAEAL